MSDALDGLDRRLLQLLEEDGRIGYAELGRRLRAPTSTVKRRVESLLAAGEITGFTAQTRRSAETRGATEAVVEVFCRGNVSTAELSRLFDAVPGVTLALAVAGAADAIVIVRAPDNAQLCDAIEGIRAFPVIERTRTSVVLERLGR